jgi:hypothetical protein
VKVTVRLPGHPQGGGRGAAPAARGPAAAAREQQRGNAEQGGERDAG